MGVEPMTPDEALIRLRERLEHGLEDARLTKLQLVARTHLSRSTIQAAFQNGGTVPSAATLGALADALGLPSGELLGLRRIAVGLPDARAAPGPGRLITEWDPHDLEVHPAGVVAGIPAAIAAGPGSGSPGPGRVLPGYVRRGHDGVLADVVQEARKGRSRMVVLVGSSSTGKTRACWEAVQPLAADGWRLWHPYDPTRTEAALADLERVAPLTVVWLNDAQHYLDDPQTGERIAAALHTLLTEPRRGPVLVLGTLWPECADQYSYVPGPREPDPHSRTRDILAGRTLTVPDTFDAHALRTAESIAEDGDRLLADALVRTRANGRVTQDLAGAPELLRRHEHAIPPARALLEAAMDARRLGVGLHLPQAFLTRAASDYITDHDWDRLADDWVEAAYADLARSLYGKQAPLLRVHPRPADRPSADRAEPDPACAASAGPVFRLADFLEQHGRTIRKWACPPDSFWAAAEAHLTDGSSLNNLSVAAEVRHRLQWAHRLRCRAADAGDTGAMYVLAQERERAGDPDDAAALYQRALDAGATSALAGLARVREQLGDDDGAAVLYRAALAAGDSGVLNSLAQTLEHKDQQDAAVLYRRAVEAGSTFAMYKLAHMEEEAGNREGAEALYLRAADAGDKHSLECAALLREQAGNREGAEALLRRAVDAGDIEALHNIAQGRWHAGDLEGAEALYLQAADAGLTDALYRLALMREMVGDRDGAEASLKRAADTGDTRAIVHLARMRDEAGNWDEAAALYRRAAHDGELVSLKRLVEVLCEEGDWGGAQALAREVADLGHVHALCTLSRLRWHLGDRDGAEALLRPVADTASTSALQDDGIFAWVTAAFDPGAQALRELVLMREEAGDGEGAQIFAHRAADAGDTHSLARLAEKRLEAGDREGAETIYRQAADAGQSLSTFDRQWPHGLEPDGSPTHPEA
ncbi:transcriptional regulator, XRE family [Actinobacteria bacterium OV450]|nr:transcriptional regulator, XRE family [Actinobacteria bacterium OV450]